MMEDKLKGEIISVLIDWFKDARDMNYTPEDILSNKIG